MYSKVVDKGLPEDISQEERMEIIMKCIQEAKDIFKMLGGKLEYDSPRNLMRSNTDSRFELGVISR